MSNFIKWTAVFLLLVGSIVANYYLTAQPFAIKLLIILGFFSSAAALALTTSQGKLFLNFVQQAKGEIHKVVWPTRQETIRSTLMVIAMVVIMSIILWAIDSILLKLLAWFTSLG